MNTTTTLDPFRLDPARMRGALRAGLTLFGPAVESLLGLRHLNRIYRHSTQRAQPLRFTERVLRELGVQYDVEPDELARIPASGPLVVIANHPFGGLDGLILHDLLLRVRPDVRLLVNEVLQCLPEMRDTCYFVDVFGGRDAAQHNMKAIRGALEWVQRGGALVTFPAGEVSHLRLKERCVTDPPWSDTIGRIVRRTGAAVLPVFFEGGNSAFFQLAGLVHPRLRTVLLARELLSKQRSTVQLCVGSPIPAGKLRRFDTPRELTDYLRLRTYILRGRGGQPERTEIPTPADARPRVRLAPIAAAEPADAIAAEVEALLPCCLVSSGPFRVLCARAQEAPTVVREIGRLRELTFREVGEGTGRATDLDRYDTYYHHLFVWNAERRHVVGAYRLGLTDEILPRYGVRGLYTRSLFRFGRRLLDQLDPAIELGRSFVLAEYQKSYSAFMLLWKGIGRFVSDHPRYRMLFGAVSISNEYHSMTKQLLMAFLQMNDYRSALASMVRPKRPPRLLPFRDFQATLLSRAARDLDDVDELVGEIECSQRHVPVLLRQYFKLNAKLLGFNIDPGFGDVIDGLVVVDLTRVDRPVLDRYLGRQEAEAFLRCHSTIPAGAS